MLSAPIRIATLAGAVALLGAASPALACSSPRGHTYLFWPLAPDALALGEVVVRADPASGAAAPLTYVPPGGGLAPGQVSRSDFGGTVAAYRVTAPAAGASDSLLVARRRTSCSRLSAVEGSSHLVGRLIDGPDGIRILEAREMPDSAPELVAGLRASAAAGSAGDMIALAKRLGYSEEGLAWTKRAAEAGNDEAIFRLISIYRYGRGVPVDEAEAQRWIERRNARAAG